MERAEAVRDVRAKKVEKSLGRGKVGRERGVSVCVCFFLVWKGVVFCLRMVRSDGVCRRLGRSSTPRLRDEGARPKTRPKSRIGTIGRMTIWRKLGLRMGRMVGMGRMGWWLSLGMRYCDGTGTLGRLKGY